MAKMQMGRFNKLVRKAVLNPHVSRVRIFEGALVQNATTEFGLLIVDDDPDYDITTTDSTVAEAQARSTLMKIDLDAIFTTGGSAAETIEWLLFKSPDGALDATTPSSLFTADVSPTTAMLRKSALAYGIIRTSSSRDSQKTHIRISRAAMRRNSKLADGDKLRLAMTHSAAGANGNLILTGTITHGI